MTPKVLPIFALALLLAADDPKGAAKKDLEKLQGTWTTVSLKYNGKDFNSEGKGKLRFGFKGDQATVEASDEIKREYAKVNFKLEPGTKPCCVDMTIAAGTQKDAVIEGIYELKGDEFKLCAKVFGKERPAEFASPEGSSIVLLVLRRDKP
jgi:uncharacterized protein (TIGR03067 family)